MVMFLGDIAFMMEVLVFGFGLVIWYWASKEKSNTLFGTAGILVAVAVLSMLCTGYYSMRYWSDGGFDQAAPMQHMMGQGMMGPGMMGNPGMMGPGMTGPGMMGNPGMTGAGTMGPMNKMMTESVGACRTQMQNMPIADRTEGAMRDCMIEQLKKQNP